MLAFDLEAEGPWEGRKGRRCSGTQRVRFEYDTADAPSELHLTWTVGFTAIWSDRAIRQNDLRDEDFSIEIVPVQ